MDEVFDFAKYSRFCLQKPFDFSKNSSIGCGGFATLVFYPNSVLEWIALIEQLREDKIPYYVLGNLTNVLPPDGASTRVVVSSKRVDGIVMGDNVFVYAGVTSGELLQACRREQRSGMEFLSGIPCTLGGALYMNAGAGGKYMSDIVENVMVLRDGKKCMLSLKECEYGYKHSVFMQNEDIILGATLRTQKSSAQEIEKEEKNYLSRRKSLPRGKSMGCVFKNPEGLYAGDLIERSGLKGLRVGGAKISGEHANFIINEGYATSADIKTLIALIKNAVKAQYGVCLEEEIRYLE